MQHLLLLALVPAALAHFHLLAPSPLGDDTTKEATAPCGGYKIDLSDPQDVHVDGEPFVVQSSHPQSNWLIRATFDDDADDDWVQIYPILQQSGLGTFCLPDVTFPSNYTGKTGIISVVGSGDDGMLYQCVAAKFVSGSSSTGSSCKNSTGVTLSETSDSKLSAIIGSPDDDDNDSGNNDNDGDDSDDDDSAAGRLALPATVVVGALAVALTGVLGL